ncbi:MAG: anthranilate phosphoribosyltransferase [bacterium]|nr:anthranilate phosphoribosyltransferase [bacterium]
MDTTQLLNALIARRDLSQKEAGEFLEGIMSGAVSPVQAGAILTALRMKGESASEVLGLIKTMRAKMLTVSAPDAMDIVGTGGDGSGTFNISTTSAFVVAGAGVKVAKHGNRAASSKCGSADVLEALGVKIELTPEQAQRVFESAGIVFMFAPTYHASMKQVIAVRRELKVRTIFNVLGPFTNPAGTLRQLTGVPDSAIAGKLATVAKNLGYKHILIVSSMDGMDEVSTSAKTSCYDIRGTKCKKITIDPAKLGFKKAKKDALRGGSKEENALMIRAILGGEKGAKRDVVVLNSACALYAGDAVPSIKDGIRLAVESIDSGRALKALGALIRESQKYHT